MPLGLDRHYPGGMVENSQAFQRWERGQWASSPAGTAEAAVLSRPFGTHPARHANPALKRWASVPGRCLVSRDERFPPGACDANRSRTARSSPQGAGAKGREANVRPKEHKWAVRQDVGGEQASTSEAQESLTACCRARRRERKEQALTRGDPGVERLREVSRGHSSVRGTHEQKGVSSEGPKERTEPTEALDGMASDRTKQRGVTTTVTTLDWLTTGRTRKAPNPSECSEATRPRDREGSTPSGPTAVCGKPHVRWCGRVPGRNPRHPTRSPASRFSAEALLPCPSPALPDLKRHARRESSAPPVPGAKPPRSGCAGLSPASRPAGNAPAHTADRVRATGGRTRPLRSPGPMPIALSPRYTRPTRWVRQAGSRARFHRAPAHTASGGYVGPPDSYTPRRSRERCGPPAPGLPPRPRNRPLPSASAPPPWPAVPSGPAGAAVASPIPAPLEAGPPAAPGCARSAAHSAHPRKPRSHGSPRRADR